MNKKVLLYGGIGLGVVVIGFVVYKVIQKKNEEKSTSNASAPIPNMRTTPPSNLSVNPAQFQATLDALKNFGQTL
jgi:hypothetical protein